MTSNIGSQEILAHGDASGASYEAMKSEVMGLLRGEFRPEFLNRLDEIVVFHGLKRSELRRIVDLQIDRVRHRLEPRRIVLELDDDARDYLADVGYDPTYGARPLKRTIQRELETPLATKLVSGEISDGSTVVVERASDGSLAIHDKRSAQAA